MKKIVSFAVILILFLALTFLLKVDIPVSKGGNDLASLPLNEKSYVFDLDSPTDFNTLTFNLVTFYAPVKGQVSFAIKEKNRKETLVKHVINKGSIPHGPYRFSFNALDANKDYVLHVSGNGGISYKLRYDDKQGQMIEDGKTVKGQLTYKLYKERTIAYVFLEGSKRASRDWFQLGNLYLISIVGYILLISAITTSLSWGWGIEKD